MNKDDYFYLGKVLKTYGSKGHLLVFLDVDDPEKYSGIDTIFIGIDNDRIPYFINELALKQRNTAVIGFEDIETAQDARLFVGREMYLPSGLLPQLKGKRFYYHEIIGFTVIDKNHGNIGTLKSILDLPRQSLMQVMFGTKEILLPMVDRILLKVDRKKKELHVLAPDGLIELYLGS
jgi:16S rRNA processing protein RimM